MLKMLLLKIKNNEFLQIFLIVFNYKYCVNFLVLCEFINIMNIIIFA